jgi:hypothetical protein
LGASTGVKFEYCHENADHQCVEHKSFDGTFEEEEIMQVGTECKNRKYHDYYFDDESIASGSNFVLSTDLSRITGTMAIKLNKIIQRSINP